MKNYFEYTELLFPPIKRAAYSDRTAWLMAEIHYNPEDQSFDSPWAKSGGFAQDLRKALVEIGRGRTRIRRK